MFWASVFSNLHRKYLRANHGYRFKRSFMFVFGAVGLMLSVFMSPHAHAQGKPSAPVAGAVGAPRNSVSNSFVFLSANYFIEQAVAVDHAVAEGLAGNVYDNASSVMKSAEPRDEFVKRQTQIVQTEKRRFGTAAVTGVFWQSIQMHSAIQEKSSSQDGAGKPAAGQYVSVTLVLPINPSWARVDLASFHLDEEGRWRLSGFVTSFAGRAK